MKHKVKVGIEALIPTMTESFKHNQTVELKVKGTSMNPTFIDQQTIVGLKKYQGPLLKRRIYLFQFHDTYVLHRYLKTKDDIHYFQGDALYHFEELENDESVLALVGYMRDGEKQKNPYSFFRNMKLSFVLLVKKCKHIVRKLVKKHG